jgi:hypothetical protein
VCSHDVKAFFEFVDSLDIVRFGSVERVWSKRMVSRLALTGPNQVDLTARVDADVAGCHDTRRSTGYLSMINDSPTVWSSRRQHAVTASTVEAEYIAVAEAAKEALWLRNLLK